MREYYICIGLLREMHCLVQKKNDLLLSNGVTFYITLLDDCYISIIFLKLIMKISDFENVMDMWL